MPMEAANVASTLLRRHPLWPCRSRGCLLQGPGPPDSVAGCLYRPCSLQSCPGRSPLAPSPKPCHSLAVVYLHVRDRAASHAARVGPIEPPRGGSPCQIRRGPGGLGTKRGPLNVCRPVVKYSSNFRWWLPHQQLCRLICDYTAHWFASFTVASRYLTEQRRNGVDAGTLNGGMPNAGIRPRPYPAMA
jgi:hypothetical protein